jgi:hypothetical protein
MAMSWQLKTNNMKAKFTQGFYRFIAITCFLLQELPGTDQIGYT